jgi:hypothetical protein
MKFSVEINPCGVIYITGFMTIGIGVQAILSLCFSMVRMRGFMTICTGVEAIIRFGYP